MSTKTLQYMTDRSLTDLMRDLLGVAKGILEREQPVPMAFILSKKQPPTMIQLQFGSPQEKHACMALVTATAKDLDAVAVGLILDIWVKKVPRDQLPAAMGQSLAELPASEKTEALLTVLRVRQGNTCWLLIAPYERSEHRILWGKEEECTDCELFALAPWYPIPAPN